MTVIEVIRAERLTRHYGKARGIEDVDMVVREGEVFGFLGPNGAGKTTFIRTLLDFIRPTSGTATVFGLDSHADGLAIRRRIGYVPGELALYDRMTGTEVLDFFTELRGGIEGPDRPALIERFAVEVDRPIRELSKGNRQKLGLVQAFMHDPDLLVLDEPTTGLDPLVQDTFQHLLRETVAAGRTVFLSSHSLDEVQHVADRVGIIREGHMVTTESVDALRGRALRHVTVRFAPGGAAAAAGELDQTPGVGDVRVHGDEVHLELTGSPDGLVKVVARHEVEDLLAEPADLDEIFLTYYREGAGATGAAS